STTERMYIEGQTDRRADTLHMVLWSGDGQVGSRDGAVEIRVADGQTEGRVGQTEWKDLDDLSSPFLNGAVAPGHDPLGYLAGIKDVAKQGSETRPLDPSGGSSVSFTRYSFALNGPAFAAYMRDQLEAELIKKGELPPGLKLDTARVYASMTGEGEIWIDSRGLPLRQVIHAEFPPYGKERIEVDITTDFSGWPDTAGAAPGMTAWMGGFDPRRLKLPGSDELITCSLLVSVLCLAGWGLFRPSRPRYALVCTLVIASMLFSPLLQSQQVMAFSDKQAQKQVQSERERQTAKAQQELRDELNTKDWNPQRDPLAVSETSEVLKTSEVWPASALAPASASTLALASASTSTDLCDAIVTDDGTDSDLDGLTDVEESCIGTDPNLSDADGDGLKDGAEVFDLGTNPNDRDSDGDGINDGAEVRGFVDDQGKHWYFNPLDVDSNGDRVIDRLEVPVSENGELACGFTNPDGSARCSNSQIDTDLDGTPDAFDFDDDNDGVPDQVDTARTRLFSQLGITVPGKLVGLANQAFTFELNNLKLDTPVFADFQLRPLNPEHLWYSLNVLDWPSGDREGQIQRVHDTTFGSSGQDANGDMRLIPMLEIIIPYKEGHYGNLPVLPGAPPITASTPVTAWLDTAQTDMFNITVRKLNEAGDLAAYVPLALVKDPVGENPVAFAARMVYWPSVEASGQAGVADGGEAQTARLIWAIQAKTDVCSSVPKDYKPKLDNSGRFVDWCEDPTHWDETTTIVHSYYDDWYLTGFEVREDRGLKTAVIYEQPDYVLDHGYNPGSYYEAYLWALANDLDETFIAARGRDTNGDGYGDVRDLTVDDIWTRFHTGSTAGETERWGIPADALQVVTHSFPHQGYLPTLPMTITPNILNSAFMAGSSPKIANPTLLFAREERFRLISLDDNSQVVQYTATLSKGILQTSKIKVNMAEDLVAENVLASLSWAPFVYDNGEQKWKSDPVDEYVAKLRARLGLVFQAAGGWGQDADAVTGAGMIATSFYLGLYTGLNRAVELDGTPLTFDYACQDEDVSFKAAAGAGAAAKAVVEELTAHVATADHSKWWTFGRLLLDTKALKAVFGAGAADAQLAFLKALGQNNAKGYGGGMATLKNLLLHGFGPIKGDSLAWRVARGTGLGIAAAAIGLALTLYATTTLLSLAGIHVPGEEYICQGIMAALMVGLAAKSIMAIKDIAPLIAKNGLSSTVASVTKTFIAASRAAIVTAVIALIVTAVLATGMFLATVIAGKVAFGSLAFDRALASAVATIIVAAWMLAIGLIPIAGPIIVAIIGAIDALIILACTIVEKTAKPSGLGWDVVKNYACGGVTGFLTKAVELLIYDQTPLVDLQAPDRVIPTNFSLQLVDQAKGFMVGNRLTVKADVITTLYRNAPFEPEKMQREVEDLVKHSKFSTLEDLIDNFGPGILYIWQFADPFIKEAAFRYKITPDKDDKKSVGIRDMRDEWDKVAKNPLDQRRYKATQRAGETGNVKFTQAGINWSPPLHLVESYATLVQECVSDPLMVRFTIIPPSLCWLRDKKDSLDISLGDKFKFDVFPASLDEFYTLADPDGDGGYALAWDERFPALADADGDGLRSRASGGNDPNDAYADTDGDALSDYYELHHALPVLQNDADSDGLGDYDEIRYNTRSQLSDSDGDGLSDKEEVDGWDFVYAFDASDQPLYTHVTSDPTDPDTDGDGLTDKLEQVYHFNPRVYSQPNVLELASDIDDADGIVAPGQPIVYTAT
ncbi:MAG: hypothetical protein JW850_10010, partial [Thermoflexales bacterium]|nr:hypothetical protein [Thermoflexales bacterium]